MTNLMAIFFLCVMLPNKFNFTQEQLDAFKQSLEKSLLEVVEQKTEEPEEVLTFDQALLEDNINFEPTAAELYSINNPELVTSEFLEGNAYLQE